MSGSANDEHLSSISYGFWILQNVKQRFEQRVLQETAHVHDNWQPDSWADEKETEEYVVAAEKPNRDPVYIRVWNAEKPPKSKEPEATSYTAH